MPVAWSYMEHVACHKLELREYTVVSEVQHGFTVIDRNFDEDSGTAGTAGLSKRQKNRKADCCTLLKRITNSKCVNSVFKSVDIDPTEEVASFGPMAPCRSHDRNHTR